MQGIGRADLVALLPQRDLEQLAFGGRGTVRRVHGHAVFAERVLLVSERFGEPAAQHRDRRLLFGQNADDFQVGGTLGGAGIIPDLERGAHRFGYHDALQFDRQRGDGEFDVLEFLPCLGPLALSRTGQRLPQL